VAGKSRYTDEDKARVLALLEANKGNVKRTNRETGVAEQTIRDWKKQAEREELTAPVVAALPAAREDVAKQMEGIRDKMLENLEAKVLNDELSGKDLLVGIGILTEKLLLLRGEATSRTEATVKTAVDPAEVAQLVQGYMGRALSAAQQRDEEIVDAEWHEEQAAQAELQAAPLHN